LTQCIAFHSYKGGTGKTTLAANLAVLLARRGYRVSLLDLDVYAPSLQAYFEITPANWINDFLADNADAENILVDVTSTLDGLAHGNSRSGNSGQKNGGRLLLGFSNPKKEEIHKLEGIGGKQDKLQLLRKFIQLREELISTHNIDYVILDTSPGIRYWSINALAVADRLFLTLKMGDIDIDGTIKMANEIYTSFAKFGAKPYLVLNRVHGYCVPNPSVHSSSKANALHTSGLDVAEQTGDPDIADMLTSQTKMSVVSAIPCYCDIQFSRKEFLTAIKYPDHPFSMKITELASSDSLRLSN